MTRTTMRSPIIAVCVVLALAACKGRETARGVEATETIAPAQPQPSPTGTDEMTQTVDVEDSRSVSEGATLEEPSTTATTTTAGDTAGLPPPAGGTTPTTTTR